MGGVKNKLKVVKADGSVEEYLHTKVIGTISSALSSAEQADVYVAEQLAEVVTYFLYHKQNRRTITSGEIFSAVKAVLADTRYSEAAIALNDYHYRRKLKRSRIEVVSVDVCELSDAKMLHELGSESHRSRWNKSKIVAGLVSKYDVDYQTARTIASMVEDKILNMELALISSSLIKQLVLGDTAALLRAERQLQVI